MNTQTQKELENTYLVVTPEWEITAEEIAEQLTRKYKPEGAALVLKALTVKLTNHFEKENQAIDQAKQDITKALNTIKTIK